MSKRKLLTILLLTTVFVCIQAQTANTPVFVSIYSTTPQAQIFVNDIERGIDSCIVKVTPGTYIIKARRKGWHDQEMEVFIGGKKEQTVIIPAMEQLFATLLIDYQPYGSTVYINGEKRGVTPLTLQLPVTSYGVRIEKEGYNLFNAPVTLREEDEVKKLTGALVPIGGHLEKQSTDSKNNRKQNKDKTDKAATQEKPDKPATQEKPAKPTNQKPTAQQKPAKPKAQEENMLLSQGKTSQPVSFGIRAGANLAWTQFIDGYDDVSMVTSFHVGLSMDVCLSEFFYLNTALLYSGKGYKYDKVENASAQYVDLPIMASLRFGDINNVQVQVNAGPYVAMGIGGSIKAEQKNEEKNFFDYYNGFDYGFALGGGVLFAKHFLVNIHGQIGFADYRNRTIGIGLGYNF